MILSIPYLKQLSGKYIDLVLNGKGMRGSIARGGIWLGVGGGSEHALRLVRNMILTRIIAPEAFGIVAIVLAVNTFFESFTQIGIKEAVIQNPRGSEYVYLNGAFWISAVRGLVLYGCAFFAVPIIADFYDNPSLVPMMRLVFISLLFHGFFSPRAYATLKEMNYRKWVFIQHLGSIIGIVTAIVMGFYLRNVWALIIGFTVENAARLTLSYIVCPFLPGFEFDRESIGSLIKFARGIFGLPIMMFLYSRADVFVLGKYVTASMLGMYSMALSLVQIPSMIFEMLIGPMLLPALSKYQSDYSQLMKGLLKSTKYVSLVFFPLFAIMIGFAPLILKVAYGNAYSTVTTAFRILSISMAIRVIGSILMNMVYATGKPQVTRLISGTRLITMLLIVVPMVILWGTNGAAVANAISAVIWLIMFIFNMNRIIGISYTRYLRALSPGICVSGGILCIILIIIKTL